VSSIDRRRFLGAGAAAVVGAAGTRLRFGRGRSASDRDAADRTQASTPGDLVGAYFTDPIGTQHIGAAFLAASATDTDVTTLLGEIAPSHADSATWWSTIGQAGLVKQVRKRSHRDFANGDVVELDGWQLAHTEARLAAIWVQTRT